MNLLFNWLFVIAYFSVFFLGLFGCFYLANNYWSARTVTGNTVFTKRALTMCYWRVVSSNGGSVKWSISL